MDTDYIKQQYTHYGYNIDTIHNTMDTMTEL